MLHFALIFFAVQFSNVDISDSASLRKTYILMTLCACSGAPKRKLYTLPEPPRSVIQPLPIASGRKIHPSVLNDAETEPMVTQIQVNRQVTQHDMSAEDNIGLMLSGDPPTSPGIRFRTPCSQTVGSDRSPEQNTGPVSCNPPTPTSIRTSCSSAAAWE